MNLRSTTHTVRTRRAQSFRQGRTVKAVRWGALVIAVGVAMGVGIGTAELFLPQRDHAEEKAAEERNPAELHNPFGTIGERFEQGGGSGSAGFGSDH